jgi:DNA-binding response OmpR family regulator
MLFLQGEIDPQFKVFHELMSWKVERILLASRPYDAWIVEKDQPLAERIIHEYRGLNLSHPPRLSWVASAKGALDELDKQKFDLVIVMPGLVDMDVHLLVSKIKAKQKDLPVILLGHSPSLPQNNFVQDEPAGIDRTFIWTGNPDILLAIIKSVEDRKNVEKDTATAGIRVILFVEDSSSYVSSLLPTLYRELVLQTRKVIEHSQTEDERLLAMRARPKILPARNYDDALELFKMYEPYVLGVISDVRFHRNRHPDDDAGIDLLKHIHEERPDIPLLLMSNEPENAESAKKIPASFIDKNSATLQGEMRSFVRNRLGFGDFVFRMPDGRELARAGNLGALENALLKIPAESFHYHCRRNDFSRWLFARTEIQLASYVRGLTDDDFQSVEKHRRYLIELLQGTRRTRRRGSIVTFVPEEFDSFTEFAKIGKGSLGGKARGLAFFSWLLHHNPEIYHKYAEVQIHVPQTLILTTDGFDNFVDSNDLRSFAEKEAPDSEIAATFMNAKVPQWIARQLEAYLKQTKEPLAIRSSSLLEDAQYRAYAGLYRTYLLPNISKDFARRFENLLSAVKLIYASTYFQGPREFSYRVGNRVDEEKMAVIIQRVCGSAFNGYFYPAISGVAQSLNYYPSPGMKPEDGVVVIALGLGKTVMEGRQTLRFSPKRPESALQISRVQDFLRSAQREFLALRLDAEFPKLGHDETITLARRNVSEALSEYPIRLLTSTYVPEEKRLRDGAAAKGYPVVTFSQVLKYGRLPLGRIIEDILAIGLEGMGGPVEIEFSVNIPSDSRARPEFCILQIRPMSAREEVREVEISPEDIQSAFLVSNTALGNCVNQKMSHIVFVDAETFAAKDTPQIALEIGEINKNLLRGGCKYLLIGPGRWGSADRWLGIPVQWHDISGAGAIVETEFNELKAEPSQGSHFFHNIVTLGINYITVGHGFPDRIDWRFLHELPELDRTKYVRHVRLESPMTLKVDGKTGRCIIKA